MWKCLHDDPATSKLLKQIYGGVRPDISYPKVNIAPRTDSPPAAMPGGRVKQRSRVTRTGARFSKEVKVPKFRATKKAEAGKPAPIDSVVMRRKQEPKIKEEQAINRLKIEYYRPPYVKPVGEDEKLRLAEKFEYGGGKALPDEMTCPAIPIPSEEKWKKSEAKRISGVLRRRKKDKGFEYEDILENTTDDCAHATNMFDQVASEIEERQKFLLNARESGLRYENEGHIMAEISHKMVELAHLTPPA
ncbi:unnamed protein product [Ascophyllum nodosum]